MSEENSENIPNGGNLMNGKQESSDSDDHDDRPSGVFRRVLSENLISPIKTPTKGLSPGSRKSSSPIIDINKSNDDRPDSAVASTSAGHRHYTSSSSSENSMSAQEFQTVMKRIRNQTSSESEEVEHSEAQINSAAAYNPCKVVVPSTANPQDSPLVFLASTGYEEPPQMEDSPMPDQNDEVVDLAGDVQLYDSTEESPKDIPTSAESEDSDPGGSSSFQIQPGERGFVAATALMREIRSVFGSISTYVDSEMNRTRQKQDTLQTSLDRRRMFVRSPQGEPMGHFSPLTERIASQLMSTLTDIERQELTYQGPVQVRDMDLFTHLNAVFDQCFSQEPFGSRGSYRACQQGAATEAIAEPSRRPAEGHFAQPMPPSLRPNAVLQDGPPIEFNQIFRNFDTTHSGSSRVGPRLFARGYSMGTLVGSENYAEGVTNRALQNRLGLVLQDLVPHQPERIPEDVFSLAGQVIYIRYPQTTQWLNTSLTAELRRVYFAGMFIGFSSVYFRWSRPQNAHPRLHFGVPSSDFMAQRPLPDFPFGVFSDFPPRGELPNRPIRESHQRHPRQHRGSNAGPSAPRPSQNPPPRTGVNMAERIHALLLGLVLDLNMVRVMADLISREYEQSRTNFRKVSTFLLCFEIMRDDGRDKEHLFDALEREVVSDLARHRTEAFAVVHVELLLDILQRAIARVQYGAMLVSMHEQLGQVRNISTRMRQCARMAMSYESWTKEK